MARQSPPEPELMLSSNQVAAIFQVDPHTVSTWAKKGKLTFRLTPGGARQFFKAEVDKFLQPVTPPGGKGMLTAAEVAESLNDRTSLHYLTDAECRIALEAVNETAPEQTSTAIGCTLAARTIAQTFVQAAS